MAGIGHVTCAAKESGSPKRTPRAEWVVMICPYAVGILLAAQILLTSGNCILFQPSMMDFSFCWAAALNFACIKLIYKTYQLSIYNPSQPPYSKWKIFHPQLRYGVLRQLLQLQDDFLSLPKTKARSLPWNTPARDGDREWSRFFPRYTWGYKPYK